METRTWLTGIGVAVVMAIAFVGWWLWGVPSSSDADVPPGATPPAPDAPPADVVPPAARPRVPIPRPERAEAPPADHVVDDHEADEATPAADPDLDTDFPAVRGASTNLARDLRSAMQAVQPELVECLAGWHEAQPEVFVGRAVFAFQLADDGIVEMDVLDVETVPEGTLACLGDVLWEEVDWPAVEQPLEVTWPIQVSVDAD